MKNIVGFLTLNAYSLIILLLLAGVFYSKKRVHLVENNTYSSFLLVTIFTLVSGFVLGLLVSPDLNISNTILYFANKVYLVFLMIWTVILNYYTYYISKEKTGDGKKSAKIFEIVTIINIIVLFLLPIQINVTDQGATAAGLSVLYIYSYILLSYIFIFALLIHDRKNLKNKKYFPIYFLAVIGVIIFIALILNPSLNYLINPGLVLIVLLMYFTIENPDLQKITEYAKNKELATANIEDKSNLLFKITQDIRNPLGEISEISSKINETKDIKNLKKYNDQIMMISNSILKKINTILDVTNIDSGNIKLFEQTYDIYNIFNQIILIYSKKESKVKFKYSISNDIPRKLYGDSTRLKQVLNSVISNSFKYTNDGFVDLDIYSIIKYDVCRLIITINDTGKEMNLDTINKIVDNNVKLTEEELAKIDDSNLDLKTVKALVDIQGGSFIISSNDNGTNITIVLDQKIEKNIEKSINETELLTNKDKILLVDDDYEELDKFSKIIGSNGYYLSTTMYGNDVINKLNNEETFKCIFIDDELTGEHAVDYIKQIKDIDSNTKVIVMLEKEKDSIREHYLKDYNFDDYLLKDDYQNEFKRIFEKKD